MRKILVSVTALTALATPLALAGAASASTTAPASHTQRAYCCVSVGHQMHLRHAAHMAHLRHEAAYEAYLRSIGHVA